MATARFLQVSDLHLGRPFAWLPADRRDERRRDQQRALEQVVTQAIERRSHAILLPGDLFDSVRVDAGTLAFVVKTFEIQGCPPVFIAPGNHDACAPSSPAWSARLLEVRGLRWPDHVHIFDSPNWTLKGLPGREEVRIWGRAFVSQAISDDRPLAPAALQAVPTGERDGVDVAVFHGSHESHCPPGQQITAPYSEDEVKASPFAYHAVGHYHTRTRIELSRDEKVRSAGARLSYAGSPVALDLSETGLHGALEVRIEYGRRLPFVEVEPVELDRRKVLHVPADVSGSAGPEQVDRKIRKALDVAGASEHDLVVVKLTGRLPAGVRYNSPGEDLRSRTFFLRIDASALRPDYDLEAMRAGEARTTEEKFVHTLLEQLDAAPDEEARATIERALYHGLDAFRLREVVPAYEEVSE